MKQFLLPIFILTLFCYSCGADKLNDVRKVDMIEVNDVGIATQEISLSSFLPPQQCEEQIVREDLTSIKLFVCQNKDEFDLIYPLNQKISFHLKAKNRTEEIIVIDENSKITAMGDYSFFQSQAYSDESFKTIKVKINNESVILVITNDDTLMPAFEF